MFNVGLILVPIRLEAPSLDPISIEFNPCLNFNSVESDLVMREIFDRLANIQAQLFTKSVSPLLFDGCLAWPTFRQFMLELLQKSTHSGTVSHFFAPKSESQIQMNLTGKKLELVEHGDFFLPHVKSLKYRRCCLL